MSNADISLANQVREQLSKYGDLAASAQQVQITAQNGTLSLTGYVPSQREQQMIEALARNTPGVVSVNNQLQLSAAPIAAPSRPAAVPGYSQSDQALADQLQQRLSSHPTLSGFAPNVRMHVQDGRVNLTGNVPSEQDREIITDLISSTSGVVSINDQLEISTVPTGRISQNARVYTDPNSTSMLNLTVKGFTETDRALAHRILDGVQTWTAPMSPINLTVENGRVTLDGTVETYEQKRNIAAAVQKAAGVNTVYDNLQVTKTP
jgi:osmotically-inducible protein OsmY